MIRQWKHDYKEQGTQINFLRVWVAVDKYMYIVLQNIGQGRALQPCNLKGRFTLMTNVLSFHSHWFTCTTLGTKMWPHCIGARHHMARHQRKEAWNSDMNLVISFCGQARFDTSLIGTFFQCFPCNAQCQQQKTRYWKICNTPQRNTLFDWYHY